MEPEQKKLIEDAVKSDYFDNLLEIQAKKKLVEALRRYSWIALPFVVVLSIFFGIELKDLHKLKTRLETDLKEKFDQNDSLKKEIELRKEHAAIQSEFDTRYRDLYEKQFSLQQKQFYDLTSEAKTLADDNKAFMESIRGLRGSLVRQFDSLNTNTLRSIKTLEEDQAEWEALVPQILLHSSTVFAYVERGGVEGDWDYHPKYFDLPYSKAKNRIRLIFSKWRKVEGYKEAEIKMLVTDSLGAVIFRGGLDLREHKRRKIPDTKHSIELQYVYTPPNIIGLAYPGIGIIPDFVVLKLSVTDIAALLPKSKLDSPQAEPQTDASEAVKRD